MLDTFDLLNEPSLFKFLGSFNITLKASSLSFLSVLSFTSFLFATVSFVNTDNSACKFPISSSILSLSNKTVMSLAAIFSNKGSEAKVSNILFDRSKALLKPSLVNIYK